MRFALVMLACAATALGTTLLIGVLFGEGQETAARSVEEVADQPSVVGQRILRRVDYGDRWPLSVDEAEVRCDGMAYVVVIDGSAYAINGIAAGLGYPALDPFWIDHPEIEGVRVPLSPLFDAAARECGR